MALIKFVLYSMFFTAFYFLLWMLLEAFWILPFLDEHLLVDVVYTLTVFLIYVLFLIKFYKRFVVGKNLPRAKSVIKVGFLLLALFAFCVWGYNLGIK